MPFADRVVTFLKERLPASLRQRLRATRTALVDGDSASAAAMHRVQALKKTAAAARRESKRQRTKAMRMERQVPTGEALEILLPARLEALRRSSRSTEAAARESAFEASTPSYRAAKGDAQPAGVTQTHTRGLTLWVPHNPDAGASLPNRLLSGWLPLADLARMRDVALGTVVLDIGANIGMTAIPRVILGDAQLVLAAEPDPTNFTCLVHNVVANGLAGFVLPERIAISDHDGDAWLINDASMGTHHLSSKEESGAHAVPVPTATIDSWLARHRVAAADVGFVKCDTQGWEPRVLDGASALLGQSHIVWQIELDPMLLRRSGTTAEAFLTRLADRFAYFIDLRGHGRRVRPTTELVASLDYLLTRRERRFTDLLLFGTHGAS